MACYKTVQKRIVSDFFEKHCEKAFSVEELSHELGRRFGADAPGKSTVYRIVQKMVEEGTLKRLVKGNSRSFVYQIAAGEHCAMHLHMKCIECGRLLHMDDEQSHGLLRKILEENGFCVNEQQTVLLGKCIDCEEEK